MSTNKLAFILLLVVTIVAFGAQPATAATTCVFVDDSSGTLTLQGDCITDTTILVPNGYTLDGQGYTIEAVDPDLGHYLGAVIKNGGSVAYVTDVTVNTANLANVCDAGVYRLRGIMLEGASGAVTNTYVLNINQGMSGCQEGNAIEVRNPPFDGTHPATVNVVVSGNHVDNYQKTGLVANGDVFVEVYGNYFSGFGPVGFIAQNGIQLGYGAMGSVHDNEVRDNFYSGDGWISAGLLMFDVNAPDVRLFRNTLRDNQRNLSLTEDSACPNMYGGIYADWGLCQ